MTSLFLPFPPSVNGLFNGKARRFKSDGYKEWLKEAKADLDAQKYIDGFKWKNHTGQVRITLMLKAPDNRLSDVDNRIKAVLDFLVKHKVIVADDNRYVRSVLAMWEDSLNQSGCFVVIEDLPTGGKRGGV